MVHEMDTHPITRELRQALFSVWGGKCAYCDAEAEQVDHIHPRAHGGPDHVENYAPACRRCNLRKSSMILEAPYVGIVQQLAKKRASKVLASMERPARRGSRARMIRNMKGKISTIDLDLPAFAIEWTAMQQPSGVPQFGYGGAHLGEVGCTISCRGRDDILKAYQSADPVWQGPVGRGPLVFNRPSSDFTTLFIDPLLIRAARIAHEMKVNCFEFDGTSLPASSKMCRPCKSRV